MAVVYIYGLIDPRNELIIENVRYVGKTKRKVWSRLCKHIQDSKTGIAPVHKWIRKLKNEGYRPTYIIIEESDENTWKEAERKYILQLRKPNRLLNVSDGGEAEGNHYHPSIVLYCYDEDGNYIKKYNSITEASIEMHVSMSKISLALNQRINKTAANCYWFTNEQKKENIVFRIAAKITGISAKLINKCLRIPTYSQTNNYKWEYKNN